MAIWGDEVAAPRVAAVTGASSGIGRAIAIGLGELGWTVVPGARRVERLEDTAEAVRAAGGSAYPFALDVEDPASVERFFDEAAAAAGQVDVLVNNAGISALGAVADTPPELITHVIGTNLIGPYLTTRRFLRDLRGSESRGDVIFISSAAAQQPWPHQVLYGVSKTGLDALAKGLHLELEGTGIRSTIVRVGPVESEIGADMDAQLATDVVEEWRRFGVLRNFAFLPAEQVARAVAMIASAPPDVFVRELYVDAMAPKEALTAAEIDHAIGRAPKDG
jgi:NAD(P)-dependent dehydrogenase (short-subunit alcohol dehydrogenase family)